MLTACATMHMQGRASCFNRFAQTQLASLQLALPNVFQQQACWKLTSGALPATSSHIVHTGPFGPIPAFSSLLMHMSPTGTLMRPESCTSAC